MNADDTDPEWVSIAVGQPFYRHVAPGCQFNYAPPVGMSLAPQCELIFGFAGPTELEREGFHEGVFEAVLVELDQVPFVCARFGQTLNQGGRVVLRERIGWQECPVHAISAQGYVPEAPLPPERWLLSLVLVDTETQRVDGIRVVTLSSEFCQAFSRVLHDRRDAFASVAEYMARLNTLYRRYEIGDVVVKGRILNHCLGGD